MEETKSRHSSRPTVATLCKLTSVTGRTIAYAATHVRFALSDAQEFSPIDLHFNYEEFYYAIVTWFEDDPEDEIVNETISWWNKKIWPKGVTEKPSNKRPAPACDDGPDCDSAVSRAARQQRKQARLTQNSSSTPDS